MLDKLIAVLRDCICICIVSTAIAKATGSSAQGRQHAFESGGAGCMGKPYILLASLEKKLYPHFLSPGVHLKLQNEKTTVQKHCKKAACTNSYI